MTTNFSPEKTQEVIAATQNRIGISAHPRVHSTVLMADHLWKEYIREMRSHDREPSSVELITDGKWNHIPLVRLKGKGRYFVMRDTDRNIWVAPAAIDPLRRIGGNWEIITRSNGELMLRWTDIVSRIQRNYRHAEFTLDEKTTKSRPFSDWQASVNNR